jgi:hypothetical protein
VLHGQTAPDGSDLMDYVGLPKTDFTVDGLDDEQAPFERGTIIAVKTGATFATFVVYGPIYERYAKVLHYTENLGLPTADEVADGMVGRKQTFKSGEIHWSPDLGAFGINNGPILDRWNTLGGADGALGHLQTDTVKVIRGDLLGEYNRFANAGIYRRVLQTTTALINRASILKEYDKQGGPQGFLRFPTSDVGHTGTKYFVDFENGVIVDETIDSNWHGANTFGDPDFFVGFGQALTGDDADDICDYRGTPDLYFHINGTGTIQGHPIDGISVERGAMNPDASATQVIDEAFQIGALRYDSTLTFHAELTGFDWDCIGENDNLGTVKADYSIDNLWGREDLEGPEHGVEGFKASFSLRNSIPFDVKDAKGTLWWNFVNYTRNELSFERFAQTFSDVAANETWWLNLFNSLFYNLAYKHVAADGLCFGMATQSIYAEHGRSPENEPIFQWPWINNQGADVDISIKQGYQLGAPAIEWILGRIFSNDSRDPVNIYYETREANEHGDQPLLFLYDSAFFGNSHSVRPYAWSEGVCSFNPDHHCLQITIFDPNYPKSVSEKEQRVEIDVQDETFHYKSYTGSTWTGGRMMYMPFHVLDHQPNTPMDEIFQLIRDGAIVAIGSAGRANQVTDDVGRKLFEDGLTGPPTRWDQLRRDDATRIPNLDPLPMMESATTMPVQLYFGRGKGITHTYEIALAPDSPEGTAVEASFYSPALASTVSFPGTAGHPDRVTLHKLATEDKAVSVAVPAGGQSKQIIWTLAGAEKQRWAELSGLTMAPGQSIKAQVLHEGRGLTLDNVGSATSAHLRVQPGQGLAPVDLGQVAIPTGSSTIDYQRPVTTLATSGGLPGKNGWMLGPVTITLTAQDLSGKGIDTIEYSRNQLSWTPYTAPFSYADEGSTVLFYRARDKALNVGATGSATIKIDTRKPTATGSVSTTSGIKLTYSVTDPTPGAGPAGVHVRVLGAGGPVDTFTAGASGTVTLSSSCSAVEFWAEDVAGNEQVTHLSVADSVRPVFTFIPPAVESSHCTVARGLVLGQATASDDCALVGMPTSDAPAKFPLGVTTVTWTARDASGNPQTATQKVTVVLDDDETCCPSGTVVIKGTSGADTLIGTASNECILGLGGNDIIEGRGGFDFIAGGSGNDNLKGAESRDYLWGGAGTDVIDGAGGDDFIDGGADSDNCSGGTGTNALLRCETKSFCNAACCSSNSCTMPAPGPLGCQTAYAQSSCGSYVAGVTVSRNGHNWQCTNGNCSNCATYASCAPGGSGCPWGTVWADRGTCP